MYALINFYVTGCFIDSLFLFKKIFFLVEIKKAIYYVMFDNISKNNSSYFWKFLPLITDKSNHSCTECCYMLQVGASRAEKASAPLAPLLFSFFLMLS